MMPWTPCWRKKMSVPKSVHSIATGVDCLDCAGIYHRRNFLNEECFDKGIDYKLLKAEKSLEYLE